MCICILQFDVLGLVCFSHEERGAGFDVAALTGGHQHGVPRTALIALLEVKYIRLLLKDKR